MSRSRASTILGAFGVLLIGCGVLAFPWVLARVLGRTRGFVPDTRDLLLLASVLCIATGALFVLLRNRLGDLANVGLAAASLVAALGLTEAYLRRFAPQIPRSMQFFRRQADWGWEFVPGMTGTAVFPSDHTGRVAVSAQGLRDRTYPQAPEPGRKRLLVLGDSFTSGIDVDAPDVFTEVLEDSLLRGVDVLNLGVNGFGPTQEYLLLQGRGLDFRPDLVILVVYVRNDFDDLLGDLDWGFGYSRPRARLQADGSIIIERAPSADAAGPSAPAVRAGMRLPALSQLHLVALVKSRLGDPGDAARIPPETRLCRTDSTGQMRAAAPLLRGVLAATDELCRARGIRFGVVVAPSVVEVQPAKYWPAIARAYHLDETNADLYLPHRTLAGICAGLGIPECDLLESLKAEAAAGRAVYYRRNQHWNRHGHAVAAREVARFLAREGWTTPEERRADTHGR